MMLRIKGLDGHVRTPGVERIVAMGMGCRGPVWMQWPQICRRNKGAMAVQHAPSTSGLSRPQSHTEGRLG